jgi:D-glycero-D-manno-heptose 1,7-bisphosphate phosphatase
MAVLGRGIQNAMTLVDGVGLWCEITGEGFTGRSAIFLDRDGVIVEDVNYLGRAHDLRMISGAAQAIARCNRLGIPIVLVSNQSGIGRGFYGWSDFQAVQSALVAALAKEGGHLDAVLACAYHADAQGPHRVADHPWRKPQPGMMQEAARRMALDLANSWMIGDRASDLAAGRAASLRGGLLVTTGHGKNERDEALALADELFIVKISSSLADAVEVPISGARAER